MPSKIAIFRPDIRIINKYDDNGKASAVSYAAYCSDEVLKDEKTGLFHRRYKPGHESSEIMAFKGADDWIFNRELLWNRHQERDKQWNAQLFKEIEFALPKIFDCEYNKELTRQWIQENLIDHYKGMIVDFSFHDMEPDDNNPHVHMMLTMRNVEGEGFGNKNRTWNKYNPKLIKIPKEVREELGIGYRTQVDEWRMSWAHHLNEHLEQNGIDARVSYLKKSEQEKIDSLEPEYIPLAAHHMEKRGEATAAGEYKKAAKIRNSARRKSAAFEEQLEDIYEVANQHSFLDRISRYWNNLEKQMTVDFIDKNIPAWSIDSPEILAELEKELGIEIE